MPADFDVLQHGEILEELDQLKGSHQPLAGDAVACARDAARGHAELAFFDAVQADASLAKALHCAEVVYPGHDRPFRVGPPVAHIGGYALRIRLFVDPVGMDQEICVKAEPASSFATWPE